MISAEPEEPVRNQCRLTSEDSSGFPVCFQIPTPPPVSPKLPPPPASTQILRFFLGNSHGASWPAQSPETLSPPQQSNSPLTQELSKDQSPGFCRGRACIPNKTFPEQSNLACYTKPGRRPAHLLPLWVQKKSPVHYGQNRRGPRHQRPSRPTRNSAQ